MDEIKGAIKRFMFSSEVKDAIEQLKKNQLTELRLANKKVNDDEAQALAEVLPKCTNLTEIDLSHNRIGDISAIALSKTLSQTFYDVNIPFINHIKLVLVGSYAGKTSLRVKYINGKYLEHPQNTIGFDYGRKTVEKNNYSYELQLIDTSDQPRDDARVSRAIFILTQGVMVFFSLVDIEALSNITLYMHEAMRSATNDFLVFLVGTQCDLIKERKVTYEQASAIAHSFGIPYFECSAKEDINVNELFETFVQMTHERQVLKLDKLYPTISRVRDNWEKTLALFPTIFSDQGYKTPPLLSGNLKSVNLSNNQITHEGTQALLALVQSCPYLTELNLTGNKISAELLAQIDQALEQNIKKSSEKQNSSTAPASTPSPVAAPATPTAVSKSAEVAFPLAPKKTTAAVPTTQLPTQLKYEPEKLKPVDQWEPILESFHDLPPLTTSPDEDVNVSQKRLHEIQEELSTLKKQTQMTEEIHARIATLERNRSTANKRKELIDKLFQNKTPGCWQFYIHTKGLLRDSLLAAKLIRTGIIQRADYTLLDKVKTTMKGFVNLVSGVAGFITLGASAFAEALGQSLKLTAEGMHVTEFIGEQLHLYLPKEVHHAVATFFDSEENALSRAAKVSGGKHDDFESLELEADKIAILIFLMYEEQIERIKSEYIERFAESCVRKILLIAKYGEITKSEHFISAVYTLIGHSSSALGTSRSDYRPQKIECYGKMTTTCEAILCFTGIQIVTNATDFNQALACHRHANNKNYEDHSGKLGYRLGSSPLIECYEMTYEKTIRRDSESGEVVEQTAASFSHSQGVELADLDRRFKALERKVFSLSFDSNNAIPVQQGSQMQLLRQSQTAFFETHSSENITDVLRTQAVHDERLGSVERIVSGMLEEQKKDKEELNAGTLPPGRITLKGNAGK